MDDDPRLADILSGSPERRPGQSEASDAVAMDVEAELAEAIGALNVVSAELMRLVARVIDEDLWDQGGVRSPTHYVCWQTGLSPARAQQVLRLAVGLGRLPVTRAAFEAGELTADQADVVVRHTPPAHDAAACELARQLTVPQLRRAMPALSPPNPSPEAAEADRRVSFGDRERGEWALSARLPIDEGATVEAALRAARDRGETWADALIKIFEAALDDADRPEVSNDDNPDLRGGDDWNTPAGPASEDQGTGPGGDEAGHRGEATGGDGGANTPRAGSDLCLPGLDDDPCPSCGTPSGPTPGRVRHRIHYHLEAGATGDPVMSLHPDTPLPPGLARDLACDGLIAPVWEHHGVPVSVGDTQRIVPDRTRREVEHRDGGCRYPGCGLTRVQVHHIIHWLDHGPTDTPNLVCLCARHHRLHHLGAYDIAGNADQATGLVFTNAKGQTISTRPPPEPPPGGYATCPRSSTWAHPTGETLDTYSITPPAAGRPPPDTGGPSEEDPPGQSGQAA